MKIALLGYGKMGKEIEQIILQRGNEVVLKVDVNNAGTFTIDELKRADVAIEFSTPESVVNNIYKCFEANVPVVVGTTGWLQRLDEVTKKCNEKQHGLFYASNFSIGVNIFFKVNTFLAKIMDKYPDYNVTMEEIHHVHKLDAPSGTGISLANQVVNNMKRKEKWVNHSTDKLHELAIISKRIDEVPGTHTVTYSSAVDDIEIKHTAHNRKGFALGAVLAAEWMKGRTGIYGMNDLLEI